jgi:predicted site-specific integrase-resolvase
MPGQIDPLICNFVGTGKAARLLGVSSEAVRLFAAAGRLPVVKTADGRALYPVAAVERLAAERAARK